MEYTIFYSWQSDSDRSTNWDFIRAALDDAAATMREEANVEYFPRVEAGMENTSGSPEIASIMLQKIRDSAIFVGDLTLVGTIPQKGRRAAKRVANPNVLIEIGYALGRIGVERVITVMNTAKGRPEELPIDFRNKRFPLTYELQLNQKDAEDVKSRLTHELTEAIQAVVDVEYLTVEDSIKRLDVHCHSLIRRVGNQPFFAVPGPGQLAFGAPAERDSFVLAQAIPRLLDLKLIECRYDPQRQLFGYQWTYTGRLLLRRLGMGIF
jgi:hypothetical protein